MTEDKKPAEKADEQKPSGSQAIIYLAVFGLMVWFLFGGGLDEYTDKHLHNVSNKVANDAVAQYKIAKRNGSAVDACVQAGLVAAAYLQAQDEANYRRWKGIQEQDCNR